MVGSTKWIFHSLWLNGTSITFWQLCRLIYERAVSLPYSLFPSLSLSPFSLSSLRRDFRCGNLELLPSLAALTVPSQLSAPATCHSFTLLSDTWSKVQVRVSPPTASCYSNKKKNTLTRVQARRQARVPCAISCLSEQQRCVSSVWQLPISKFICGV